MIFSNSCGRPAEAYILKKMLDNLNIVCNKNELEDIGWEGNPVSTSSLTVVIASLRKKYIQ